MIRRLRNRASNLIRFRILTKPRRGQAVIMFALMAVPMIGMLGLAVDGGLYLYARRTTQAAADAAALAGARQLSKSISAQSDVEVVAAANGQGGINPSVLECRYVDDSTPPSELGSCTALPPLGASGVLVRTQETVPTFFITVIPGAPEETITTATAIARVQVVSGIMADAPFIVCGYGSWDVSSDPDRNLDILQQDSPPMVNPDAIGTTFRIWDPQLAQEGAGCDEGSQFKGMASDENQNQTTPGWLKYKSGANVGQLPPITSDVNGPEGCKAGTTDFDNCVLILPIATNDSPEGGPAMSIYGVGFAAFMMSRVDTNSYNGTLLDDYILGAPGVDGWTAESGGLVSIRLAG